MPFTSETAKLYGGKKPGAGRPPKEVLDAWEKARQRLRRRMAADADNSYAIYKKWQKVDPATSRHAISTVLGDEQTQQAQRPISINFVQYNNTVQLRPEAVSAAVLAGNGEQKAGGVSVAPASWQRQDGAQLHDIEDVS